MKKSVIAIEKALRNRITELEAELSKEEEASDADRHFALRQTQRLIDAGLWVPGQDEPDDVAMDFDVASNRRSFRKKNCLRAGVNIWNVKQAR